MSKSYTPPDRSTYDPGWNDPPPMPVAEGVAKPAKTKLNLNKRIAFPMAGASGNASPASSVKTTAEGLPLPFSTAKYKTPPSVFQPAPSAPDVPPPTLPLPPPAAVPLPSESGLSEPIESAPVASAVLAPSDDSVDLSTAREFCQSVFVRLSDAIASKLDAGKSTEIRKRLDLLNGIWLEDKLDRSTQIDLYNIAKALDENQIESAMEQHRQFAVNHGNACNQWGTALRQIIFSLDASHVEQGNQGGPAVLPDNEVNVVHFLNVSSTAHVIDAPTQFPINPIAPLAPLNSSAPADFPPSTNENTPNEDSGVTSSAQNEPRTNTSKTSRFGRILHI